MNKIADFELNKIYCMDCLDMLKKLPDNSIDLVVTDPPYGIGADVNQQKAGGKNGWRKYDLKTNWDESIPSKEVFDEIRRVSKNQIIWGGNYFTEFLPPKMCWLVWDKGQREFSLADGELAWTSFEKRLMSVKKNSKAETRGGKDRIHPTQKPVYLYRFCLLNYAEKGMKILDTHGGSFSIAIACEKEGFDLDICEIDTEYFNNGIKRFKLETAQTKLF